MPNPSEPTPTDATPDPLTALAGRVAAATDGERWREMGSTHVFVEIDAVPQQFHYLTVHERAALVALRNVAGPLLDVVKAADALIAMPIGATFEECKERDRRRVTYRHARAALDAAVREAIR